MGGDRWHGKRVKTSKKKGSDVMRRFCYRCGALEAKQGPLINGLCQRCFVEENRLLRVPPELEIIICGRCGAYVVDGRWHQASGDDPITEAARRTALSSIRLAHSTFGEMKLLRPEDVPKVALSVRVRRDEGVIDVRATGKIHELQTEPQVEEAHITFKIKRVTCDACTLKSAHHYEAIIQVRGKFKCSDVRKTLERIATEASGQDRMAFISRVEEHRKGVDFYVNPVRLARQMAGVLRSRFGAEVKESKKLVGQTRDGRKRYKFTISVRIGGGS